RKSGASFAKSTNGTKKVSSTSTKKKTSQRKKLPTAHRHVLSALPFFKRKLSSARSAALRLRPRCLAPFGLAFFLSHRAKHFKHHISSDERCDVCMIIGRRNLHDITTDKIWNFQCAQDTLSFITSEPPWHGRSGSWRVHGIQAINIKAHVSRSVVKLWQSFNKLIDIHSAHIIDRDHFDFVFVHEI